MMYVKQLNIDKTKLAHENLRHLLNREKTPSIFMIQEPYYFKNKLVGIPKNYKIFGVPKSRAIIIAHESLDLIYSNEFSTEDITVCFMNSSNRYFASIYLDILKDPIHPYMIKMAEFFASSKCNAIWCLDSNAHSELWGTIGDQGTNSRGESLEFFIMSYNAYILNWKKNIATFQSSRASSVIDISLAFGAYDDISDWKVETEYTFSFHKLITMKIGVKSKNSQKKVFPKINWKNFKETLKFEEVFYATWDKNTIENESQKVEEIINNTIKKCTTYHRVSTFKDSWWTQDLFIEKKKVKKLFYEKMRYRSAENEEKFSVAKKSYAKNIRHAKRASWYEFVQNIDSPKNISKFNKIINKNNRQEIGLLKSADGVYARSIKDSINLLMETHLPECEPPTETRSPLEENNVLTDKIIYDMNFDSFIEEKKVKMAFATFKSGTAPGLDGIKFQALQLIGDDGIKRITNLYKAIIEIGYTPDKWLVSNLIFLPKPCKTDYETPKSFRGISLTQTLLKGLERLIQWELEETVGKTSPVSSSQFAFKKGSSTEHCLSVVTDKIQHALLNNKLCLVLFNDISQAFDNLNFSKLIAIMEEKKYPPNILNWFKYYLSNRYAVTTVNNISVKKKIRKGCGQGAILSPGNWNIYFDKWLLLEKEACDSIAFADDGSMILEGIDPTTMVDIMQRAIAKTLEFGKEADLQFNPNKTVAMFFHRKNNWKTPKKLEMSGVQLEYVESTKYLGQILDSRLNFSKHIEYKIKKAKNHLFMFRNAITSYYGPTPRCMKWGYTGIILQGLLYGSNVFARACKTNAIIEKLAKLNRLAACCIAPFRKSSPTNGVEIVLHLPPIDLLVEKTALKIMLRILPTLKLSWDGIGKSKISSIRWCTNKLKELGIDPMKNDTCKPSLNISRRYKVDLDSFQNGKPISKNYTICYTDGSKLKNDQTGYGLLITRGDEMITSKSGRLSPLNSVFQSEVFAIDQSCQILKNLDTKSVTIFSDSQAGLAALAGVHIDSKVVKNCINSLNELGKTCKIELCYVRGHSHHVGNEWADFFAREGASKEANMVNLPSPKANALRKISHALNNSWNARWGSSDLYRQTKIWFPVVNKKKSDILLNLERRTLGDMIGLLTGHNRLNYHQSKIDASHSPTCRFCWWEDESSWHLIGECEAFWRSRTNIFNQSFLDNPPEWSVKQLLKFYNKIKLKDLLNPGQLAP